MLIFSLVAALTSPQTPPAPPEAPRVESRVMVFSGDGPGRMDKDEDGFVTRDEFVTPMGDAFARMDKDGDGRLSTDELTSGHRMDGRGGMSWREGGAAGGPGVRRFEFRHGLEGVEDGERHEEVVILRRGGEHGGEHDVRVHHMDGAAGHGDMDRDGDGKVSEEEFIAPLRDAFRRMDADSSGALEEGERGHARVVRREVRVED
jgi:hypothetical protein